MTAEEMKQSVSAKFPAVTYDETGEFLNILIDAKDLRPLIETLAPEQI